MLPENQERLPDASGVRGHLRVLKQQKKEIGSSPWVFPLPTDSLILPDSVLHILHRVLKRAGLPRVRFHDLRHTFAMLALQNGWALRRCPGCWDISAQASRWTPTPTSPPTHSSRRRKRWAISYPVLSDGFRYPLPLGSAFGSEKSSWRKQQLMQTKRPETLQFRIFLARREGFEPPAFWSVARRSIQLS